MRKRAYPKLLLQYRAKMVCRARAVDRIGRRTAAASAASIGVHLAPTCNRPDVALIVGSAAPAVAALGRVPTMALLRSGTGLDCAWRESRAPRGCERENDFHALSLETRYGRENSTLERAGGRAQNSLWGGAFPANAFQVMTACARQETRKAAKIWKSCCRASHPVDLLRNQQTDRTLSRRAANTPIGGRDAGLAKASGVQPVLPQGRPSGEGPTMQMLLLSMNAQKAWSRQGQAIRAGGPDGSVIGDVILSIWRKQIPGGRRRALTGSPSNANRHTDSRSARSARRCAPTDSAFVRFQVQGPTR